MMRRQALGRGLRAATDTSWVPSNSQPMSPVERRLRGRETRMVRQYKKFRTSEYASITCYAWQVSLDARPDCTVTQTLDESQFAECRHRRRPPLRSWAGPDDLVEALNDLVTPTFSGCRRRGCCRCAGRWGRRTQQICRLNAAAAPLPGHRGWQRLRRRGFGAAAWPSRHRHPDSGKRQMVEHR